MRAFATRRPRRNPFGGKKKRKRERVSDVFVATFNELRKTYLAAAAIEEVPWAKVQIGWELVRTIGMNIQTIALQRDKLTSLDDASLAAFDADLDGLRERYSLFYKPIFERLVQVEPDAWTDEDWQEYHHFIEGPVLLWNIEQCREQTWPDEVPRCEGPDLLTSFSLINQVYAATDVQIQMGTGVMSRVGAVIEQMADTVEEGMVEAIEGVAEIAHRGLEVIETAAVAGVKAAGRTVGAHLWIVPVAVIGFFALRGRRRR